MNIRFWDSIFSEQVSNQFGKAVQLSTTRNRSACSGISSPTNFTLARMLSRTSAPKMTNCFGYPFVEFLTHF